MIKQDQKNEYLDKFYAAQNGFITQQEWMDYCAKKLEEIMLENVDVFKRLKDR